MNPIAGNSDIRLDDEGDHVHHFPSNENYWHEYLYTCTASAGEWDVLLQTRVNMLRIADHDGQWMHTGHFVEHETTLVVVPKSQRNQGMTDHDFVHTGHYHTQAHPFSDLRIDRSEDAVTWKVHGRNYVSRPPYFEARGSHGGVELDLVFKQLPPALWVLGPFEKGEITNTGGYDAPCEVQGAITVAGRKLVLENGYGIHEHMVTGKRTRIIDNLPQPDRMYWEYLINKDIFVYYFSYPKPGIELGHVRAFGEEFHFDQTAGTGVVRNEILEHWNDPRSGQALASRWHLEMTSDRGRLDLQIAAHGRSYLYWVMNDGLRIEIWQIGTAKRRIHRCRRPQGGAARRPDLYRSALYDRRRRGTTHETLNP